MMFTRFVSLLLILWLSALHRMDAHAVGEAVGKNDAHTLRQWKNTSTNTSYKATFLLIHKDDVFLEDVAGKVVVIPYNQLCVIDKAIADEHRERIRTLNRSLESVPLPEAASQSAISAQNIQGVAMLSLAAVLMLCAGGMLGFSAWKLLRHQRLSWGASIGGAVAALMMGALCVFIPNLPTVLLAQTLNIYSKGIAYPTPVANLRSLKVSPNVVVSNTLSTTPLSFQLSAVDSMKIISTTTDPALMDAAFAPYKPSVATAWDDTYFYVAGNGIPAQHNMMIGITAWIAQVPIPHPYTGTNRWSIPLKPELAATPLSIRTNLQRGAIAVAVNGLPIFNALNASGEDSKAKGELDQWGGHCGRADDYHYHVAPLQFEATSGLKPIAFALDGYAVYGSKEPDGASMLALDQYHGHTGANGVYHYHGTTTSPYMIEAMRGKVSLDPRSTAPENQIIPQAMTQPLRMTPFGIDTKAVITNLTANALGNGYLLEYTVSGRKGTVSYTWTGNGLTGLYTFVFTDPDSKITTQTFTRQ